MRGKTCNIIQNTMQESNTDIVEYAKCDVRTKSYPKSLLTDAYDISYMSKINLGYKIKHWYKLDPSQ